MDHDPLHICRRRQKCVPVQLTPKARQPDTRLCRLTPEFACPSQGADDLALVERLSNGKVDLTYGSALDIFGGSQVKFDDLVAYNQRALAPSLA